MKKKLISVIMASVMAVTVLAGCGLSGGSSAQTSGGDAATAEEGGVEVDADAAAAGDPAVTLVMAEVNPIDTTISGQFCKKFAEEVHRLSGGSITIDLQGAGVLGNEVDVLDQMVGNSGTVDITRTSINTLNQYGVGNSVVLSLPFVFVSRDHYWKWVDSESGQAYLAELHDAGKGLRAICYGEEGFRSFFTSESKPITTPDDMKGMKIRSSSDPIMVGMIEALGATSSPVAYNEVYTSIQNGTIDGAENPVNNYYSNAFYEVAKNLTLDEHTLGATQIVMTDASYDSLTPAQQEAINEAGKLAEQYCREISEQGEKDTFEKLKEAGVNIIPVDDKTPWQEKVQPLIDAQLSTDDLKAFYQTIVDMAE